MRSPGITAGSDENTTNEFVSKAHSIAQRTHLDLAAIVLGLVHLDGEAVVVALAEAAGRDGVVSAETLVDI
jgi:ATP-dependent Clp protease adapter protein ClpS